jgi:hypothetical protein
VKRVSELFDEIPSSSENSVITMVSAYLDER